MSDRVVGHSFGHRVAAREYLLRCYMAERLRRVCWRVMRIADKVDPMTRAERREYRKMLQRYMVAG